MRQFEACESHMVFGHYLSLFSNVYLHKMYHLGAEKGN